MRALARRGLDVCGVKCGPDYIDPAFHAAATGRESFNLDSWTMEPELLAQLALRASEDADIVVAEGAMGLFDGAPGAPGQTGASADIAAHLGWPTLLVMDVSGQAQSAAAIARGVALHDARVKLAGVLLNRVGSERHRRLAQEAIEAVGIKVFGALPRDGGIALPERHLGLVQAGETPELACLLDRLADRIDAHIDVDALLAAAAGGLAGVARGPLDVPRPPGGRIAVARDESFSFFYPHLCRAWRETGATVAFFSPLADQAPPEDCDACWLPGGYPELHAGRLAAAGSFLEGLRRFAATRPVHGECGGYMTLGRTLTDAQGRIHAMAGLLDLATSFAQRKLNLGYRRARLSSDCALGAAGDELAGHEFHYATIVSEKGPPFAAVTDAYSQEERPAGLREGLVTGSFFHAMTKKKGRR